MTYATENKVGSPRLHLLNMLKEAGVYSEYPKEGFVRLFEEAGYYFSEELLDKGFDFENCVHGKTSEAFMTETGYSRPKINAYIEKHGRVVYVTAGYYDLEAFRTFIEANIKEHVERRGRPKKDAEACVCPQSEDGEAPHTIDETNVNPHEDASADMTLPDDLPDEE